MVKLRHYDKLGTARFITFSCYGGLKLLDNEAIINIIMGNLRQIKEKYQFNLLGYVIMPNHVHLVIHPAEGTRIGKLIADFKAKSGFKIIQEWKKINHPNLRQLKTKRDSKNGYAFWQKRCYDHNCRTLETVREKVNYCHNNPVEAGLVCDPGEWQWSSFRFYNGIDDGIIDIDRVQL